MSIYYLQKYPKKPPYEPDSGDYICIEIMQLKGELLFIRSFKKNRPQWTFTIGIRWLLKLINKI